MDKSKKIRQMFSMISHNYDFLNHLLSFGQDIYWRKRVAARVKVNGLKKIADIACGTGDLAIEISKVVRNKVVGIDFCFNMLRIMKGKKGADKILSVNGDGTMLPVKSSLFDAVTIAFGIRNIPERSVALKEFYRILHTRGILFVLEFDIPENFFFRFYFRKVLPFIGGFFSSREAYEYLPDSVEKFPREILFVKEIENVGFVNVNVTSLSFGMVKLYEAHKK